MTTDLREWRFFERTAYVHLPGNEYAPCIGWARAMAADLPRWEVRILHGAHKGVTPHPDRASAIDWLDEATQGVEL